ncbi:MAG: hypothetical protein HONDAALG_01528 [Gammaproteobacteria bacterium]|nr:hypothetical protein [Gammaproteobacteria bacterium]
MKQRNHAVRILILVSLGAFLFGCMSANGFRRGTVPYAVSASNDYGSDYDFKHAPQPF